MNALLLGRVRTLNTPRKVILIVLLIAGVYAAVHLTTTFVLERLNEARFRSFAREITPADHITVTHCLKREPAFTIPGKDATTFIRAVACARRWRTVPWGYDVPPFDLTLTFFAGTNVLGAICSNGDFVDFKGKRYHDDLYVIGHLLGRYSYSGGSHSSASNEEPK